jgi:HPt (histidine-containing phosphotransfer) domain-containing protein
MDDALLFFQKDMLLFAVFPACAGKRQMRTSFGWPPPGRAGPAVMTSSHASFAAFMQGQRAEFRSALPERLEQVESFWRQVRNGQTPALADLERCAHGLAGSGATFGFAALGDAARVLEMAVSPWVGAAHALTPAAQAELGLAVDVFCRSLCAEIGMQGD